MKKIYNILSSFLVLMVVIGGIRPACLWFFHQPRVPKIQ